MNSESTINPAVWQSLNDMYLGYGLVQWDDGKLFIDWAKKKELSVRQRLKLLIAWLTVTQRS